ncbi:MotA/TolQ/ExbB proton channel family protein [Aminipila terrae]|uniref:MotA/TolQ/ExbB proton channel family protein n=1 Tax=Aminipila terrae TaxID=2697030 RepID=UPI001FABE485|nr:MotA/TolQ/ExbB proton channel family protein [Aminipila terrae]
MGDWQSNSGIFHGETEARENVPGLIRKIHADGAVNLRDIIENSVLIKRQKEALFMLTESGDMSRASLTAMAQRLLATEEGRYEKATAITDLVSKLGPMFGLLGTLIPLGPGVMALGKGDIQTLSMSFASAFDSTIVGVITAAVCFVISNIRKRWYDDYMISFEAVMECVLEEVTNDDQKQWTREQA